MKPKKKSNTQYIINILLLLLFLFVALHLAMATNDVKVLIEKGEILQKDELINTLKIVENNISKNPLNVKWIEKSSSDYLMIAFGIWFLMILAISNKKRNYIHGKEYGTARWGTLSDIKMLFAENIAKKEIRELGERRFFIFRYFLVRKIIKKWKIEGKKLQKVLVATTKKSKAEIKKEVNNMVNSNIKNEWKPLLYKDELVNRINEVKKSAIYTEDEKEEQYKLAKKEYDKKCQAFYHGSKEKIKSKYENMDRLLTKTERISLINRQSINANDLVVGGSGSGKTRGYIIPNILQAHSSFVITDPKGEILEKTGYFLENVKGYKVRVLDLCDKEKSYNFNPFYYLHPERLGYEERVISMVKTIMANTSEKTNSSADPFWEQAESMFLQALIYAIPKAFPTEEQNFKTLLSLIEMLVIKDSSEEDYKSDLDLFFENYKNKIQKEDFAYKTFKEFRKKAPDKTGNSVLMTVLVRLQAFRSPEIQRILAKDSMDLQMVGEEKTAIFVIVPPTDKTFNFISGMLFTIMFQEIQYSATVVHRHEGQCLPVPIRFLFDEFANTCIIPDFVQILAYARSFGVGIAIILQSLEQIKKMYDKEWGVIIDNCSSMLYLGGIKHIETLNYFRDLLGKGTFDKKTTGRTRGRQGSSSINEDVVGRGLLEADELYAELNADECILFVSGRRPFFSKKYNLLEHPNYIFTSDFNNKYSFTYHMINQSQIEKIPHGEEKIKLPTHNFYVDDVEVIKRLTKNIKDYELVEDEELIVEDGETIEEEVNQEFEKLFLEEIEKSKEDDKENEQENFENKSINSLVKIAKDINDYELIEDEELIVEDGETTEEEVNQEFEKYLEEKDEDFDIEKEEKEIEKLVQEL